MSLIDRLFLCVPALVASPTYAQEPTAGVWAAMNVRIPIAARVDSSMEFQWRVGDAAKSTDQLLLRPSINFRFDDGFAAAAGYAYVRTNPLSGHRIDEHRSWQQISMPIVDASQLQLTSRARLEQRFVENRSGAGWRLRHQLRLAVPLGRAPGVEALVWNEHFFGLNRTSWGQRGGMERVRSFVGAAVPLSSAIRLESGYLNQTVFRDGEDRMDHIFSTSLSVRL